VAQSYITHTLPDLFYASSLHRLYALMQCSPITSKMRFKNTNIMCADHLCVLISRHWTPAARGE